MPQDRPPYAKLIFISYDDQDEESLNYAVWIYQKLKYAGLPVRTYHVDEAIGGGGFAENSIAAASPMIVVLSERSSGYRISQDIELAHQQNKEIIFFCLDHAPQTSQTFRNVRYLISQSAYDRDDIYAELWKLLAGREYPARHWPLYDPDGAGWLTRARDKEQRKYYGTTYAYLRVFNDLFNKDAKIAVLRDLGQQQILWGLAAAALQSDPQEEVRASAALTLAHFERSDVYAWIRRASDRDTPSDIVTLYAQVALAYRRDPAIIRRLVQDMSEAFEMLETTPNSDSMSVSQRASLQEQTTQDFENDMFISYARKDSERFALELARRLEELGYKPWIDTRLEPGTPAWTQAVERAIRHSRIVIVLQSPEASSSRWVRREIAYAEQERKELIPVIAVRNGKMIELINGQGLRGDPALCEDFEQVLRLLVDSLTRKGINPGKKVM